MINQEDIFFVIYHKHVSDRQRNILTPAVRRNNFSNSVVQNCNCRIKKSYYSGTGNAFDQLHFPLVVYFFQNNWVRNPVKLLVKSTASQDWELLFSSFNLIWPIYGRNGFWNFCELEKFEDWTLSWTALIVYSALFTDCFQTYLLASRTLPQLDSALYSYLTLLHFKM